MVLIKNCLIGQKVFDKICNQSPGQLLSPFFTLPSVNTSSHSLYREDPYDNCTGILDSTQAKYLLQQSTLTVEIYHIAGNFEGEYFHRLFW